MPDVLVKGAGPAGLALAAALRERGVDVRVRDPAPGPWIPSYAAWAAELPPDWPTWAEASWDRPQVWLDEDRHHQLDARYVRIDGAALRQRLLERLGEGRLRPDAAEAAFVVDASGAGADVSRSFTSNPGFQVAWGELVELDVSPSMLLMDYRGPDDGPPAFLYALPLPDGRCFLEETILVARPPPPVESLRARLHARLDRMGLRPRLSHAVERCFIPMGLAPPTPDAVACWGAAAGLTHPATGYSVARALREAPVVADAIVAGLSVSVEEARRRALAAAWPEERRRAWAFYLFGMEALLRMDLPTVRDFFHSFFGHDRDTWLGWLSGTLPLGAIPRAMSRHFARAGWGTRASLVGTSLGQPGLQLAGRLLGIG